MQKSYNRVSQITPKSSDKAGHLRNCAPSGQKQPKKKLTLHSQNRGIYGPHSVWSSIGQMTSFVTWFRCNLGHPTSYHQPPKVVLDQIWINFGSKLRSTSFDETFSRRILWRVYLFGLSGSCGMIAISASNDFWLASNFTYRLHRGSCPLELLVVFFHVWRQINRIVCKKGSLVHFHHIFLFLLTRNCLTHAARIALKCFVDFLFRSTSNFQHAVISV